MGPLEERLRDILGEVCSDELLERTVEDILEAHCDVYALYAMSQLMASETKAAEMAKKRVPTTFQFYQGKIEAFQELFVKVAFDGLSLEEETLSDRDLAEAKKFWREKVEAFIAETIGV